MDRLAGVGCRAGFLVPPRAQTAAGHAGGACAKAVRIETLGTRPSDDAARHAGHEGYAQRKREHQAIDPAAPLEDQNSTEPMEPRQHRGQNRNGRETDEQRQQELLGRQDAMFHGKALYRPAGSRLWA